MASAISFGDANSGLQVGISNAPITAQFCLPPERPETPPSPLSTVPFRRDPDFIDRRTLVDEIHEKCSAPASRIALVGLGGVGKSQLAIEYSYRIRDRSPETWVFWIHASNISRFEHSCREIADRVKIPGRKDPTTNIFKLVHDCLHDEKKGKWLLILDNVDDDRFLHEPPPTSQDGPGSSQNSTSMQPLLAYLPLSQNGSIIITTRSKGVASNMIEESDIIAVEPMDKTHALVLFEKKLGMQVDREDVIELTAALEFMPLAIVQAAAYIKQRAPRYSVRQYIEDFRKSDRKKASLLDYEGGHLRRDREAKNSIMITWQMSFDHVRQIRPSAADLLSLMSFFDRQGIPEALLRNPTKTGNGHGNLKEGGGDDESDDHEDSASESSMSNEFEDDVLTLRNYSFISVNEDATTFEMHSLVQLATRKWLEAHGQLEQWKQRFIENLSTEFPIGEYENWERCQSLFPHAKSAIAQQPNEEDSLREWALLLYNAAWYAWRRGNIADAKEMSVKAMKAEKKLLGPDHRETLRCNIMVGLAYRLGGQWNEAEELQVQVMETCKRVLGAEHPFILNSMANLASTYRDQGRWKEAEELQVQVMETCKRVLGAEHPFMLNSIANLASTYSKQGRWKEAEELQVQVMETGKRVLGTEHPDMLKSMNSLALTYRSQGRWKEAEELVVQVIETQKRVLGVEHPDTLISMDNLARTWKGWGRHMEALNLMEECVQLQTQILGVNHPDTLSSCTALIRWQTDKLDISAPAAKDTI